MRVGILTYHNACNYGAMLQAVATNRIFSKFFHAELIDYRNPNICRQLNLIRFEPSFRGVKRSIHDITRLKPRHKAIERFREFLGNNARLSPACGTDPQDFARTCAVYDILVSGSDQVWNPECQTRSGNIDGNYWFQNSLQRQRLVAYSSSLGDYRFDSSGQEFLRHALSRYHSVSVREDDGAEYVGQLLGKDVPTLMDPSLLMGLSEWKELSVRVSKPPQYIVVYQFNNNNLNYAAIKRVQAYSGLPVICIDQALRERFPGAKQYRDIGPGEFLDLVINAEIILTDSFHGVCFSINFGKPFIATLPRVRANRVSNLVNRLGLSDRLVRQESDIDVLLSFRLTNRYERSLNDWRAESLDFVKRSIS